MVPSQPRASTSASPAKSGKSSTASESAGKDSKSAPKGDNASAGSRPSRKTALAAQEQVKSLATSSVKKRKPKSEIEIVIDTAKKPKVEQATSALRVLEYKPPEPKKPKTNGGAASRAQGKDKSKDPGPSLRVKLPSKDSRDRAAKLQAKEPSPPPPPKRKAPPKPNLKSALKFTRLEMSAKSDSGALNDSRYLERLHLREFFARFVHLLYPPGIELEQRTARRRTRKNILPSWLTAALSSHLTTFWDSDQHPLGLLLAMLTAMENEMKDAGKKHGEPLLKYGKASYNLFVELIQELDQLDLDDLDQATTGSSRLWIAASELLSEENIPAFRLSKNFDATPEERKKARRAQQSGSSASESEDASSESSDSSDGQSPASEAVRIQLIPPPTRPSPQKKVSEDSETEPSSSDEEDAGPEQPAAIDPTLQLASPSARPSKDSKEPSSSGSGSGSGSSSSQSSSEQSDSDEEAVSTSSSAKQPPGRRSDRVSQQEKARQDQEAAAAKAARLSRLRKGGRTTRASAPTADERAQLEAQKEQEAEAAMKKTAALKTRKKSKKREALLNKFSPSRPIEDFERQYIILGYVDLLINRSGDFRSALDEGIERQKQAKSTLRKANGEFMQAKSEHQKKRPGDSFSLPKWMRIGDELVARHEEQVARLYPEASTSHARFQLHQTFYNIYIPTVLSDGLNPRPPSTNHEAIDPSLSAVADGGLLSSSALPLASWTVLAQGPAPPSSWFTTTSSGAVRSVDYLSQPSHRMPWHKFQKPEEIRDLISVLEAQIKIRVWERKMTAFENETDKGAPPRDSTATEASTAKTAEELVQEAEERRANEIVSALDKFATYYEHVLQS